MRKEAKWATSSPGLFPQKMGGAGPPFEAKAPGTRLAKWGDSPRTSLYLTTRECQKNLVVRLTDFF